MPRPTPARRLVFICALTCSVAAVSAFAEFPWKATSGDDSDPYAYHKYMYIDPAQYPPGDIGDELWKYSSKTACELYGTEDDRCSDAINANPQELYGVTGASVDIAWETTTGRPDVVIAVTDSGIKWNDVGVMQDLRYTTWLNRGELPVPQYSNGTPAADYDANMDGVFNVGDYEGDPRVRDVNANGMIDPEDLIFIFSDGVDDDGNGYTDDFCGWDTYEDDNDPFDEVQYGHGSGEAKDSVAEANNGHNVGVSPNCMVMHMRVGDSFIGDINDFAEAVAYATDNGASVIQCALGTLNNSRFAQEAINYAYRRGVVLISSAADESAGHHNLPAMLEHGVTMNSIGEPELPLAIPLQPSYLEFRGCTNFGAYITASVPSNSCSSEATGRAAGMAALLYSAARNAVATGTIADYGALDGPAGVRAGQGLSAEEVDQIIATTADDINFITPVPYTFRVFPETERYPATAGWDPFFGYGRINAARMVKAVKENKIPPEADITSPRWFEIHPPDGGPIVIEGTAASRRSAKFSYEVRWALWSWRDINTAPSYTTNGVTLTAPGDQTSPVQGTLATISASAIANAMTLANGIIGGVQGPAVDPITGRGDHENRQIPDKFSVIVRISVTSKDASGTALTDIDGEPLQGVGTKCFFLHRDTALFAGYPMDLDRGMAASPRFADLDNDGVDEMIVATSNGDIHAFDQGGGQVPGWPVKTSPVSINYGAAAYQSGEITTPIYAAVLQSPAVGDIDRDGNLEVIVGDFQGRITVYDRHGQVRPGFPVRSNPAYSAPQPGDRANGYYAQNPGLVPGDYPGGGTLPNDPDLVPDLVNRKDKLNSSTWWFLASPTLGDIDPSDEDLEILAGGMDRHLYAFKSDGSPVPGWPVMLRDPATVASVDPVTHRVTNIPGISNERGSMIVASPAVGDLDGDGLLDVVSGVNEQYEEPVNTSDAILPTVLSALDQGGGNNRVYAIHGDGALHGGGPGSPANGHPNPNAYMSGWPARIATLAIDLLPVVGEGPNGAPVLADIDNNGDLEVGIYGTVGPAYVLGHDGVSHFGRSLGGLDNTLLMEPLGLSSNSLDTPAIPAVGGGIFTKFSGLGDFSYATGTAGLGKFLDLAFPDDQILSDNHLTAWSLTVLPLQRPFFPREVNDLHFLSTPASADVDGDGLEEILDASAYYDLHAFNALGEEPGLRLLAPNGWPKFTGGWHFSSPSVGDFDGDGLRDIAAATREGWLFLWHGNGATTCDPASWPQWGHDTWNTNNAHTDTTRPAAITDASVTTTLRAIGGGTISFGLPKGHIGFDVASGAGGIDGGVMFHDKRLNGPKIQSTSITGVAAGSGLTLRWTAPADDQCGGPVTSYDIRYANVPLTDATWTTAATVPQAIIPANPGEPEQLALDSLAAGDYCIAVQSVDASGNRSAISNVVSFTVDTLAANEAWISGTATVNGSGNVAFDMFVIDNGEPGAGNDWFEISLSSGYSASGTLATGNIDLDFTEEALDDEPNGLLQTLWTLLFGWTGLEFLLGLL